MSSAGRPRSVSSRHLRGVARLVSCAFVLGLVAPSLGVAQQGSAARGLPEAPRVAVRAGTSSQPGTDNVAIADALFTAARSLMEAQRYPEACAKFAESYRLDPASGTLLNLAVCHEREGKLASAWGEFREALHEAENAQRADRAQLAREHADALGPQLPFLALEVPSEARVPGLEIVRNGVPTLEAAWAEELPVDPGDVRIEVRAPGYQTRTRDVHIAPRQHLTVRVPAPIALSVVETKPNSVVLPLADEAEPATERAGADPRRAVQRRRWASVGLLVAGALTTSVGIAAGVRTLHRRAQSDDACPVLDGERRCTQAGVDAMASAHKWALTSDLTLGLGVVGLAAGTYLLLTAPRADHTDGTRSNSATRRDRRQLTARWSWDVAAGPHGARTALARSF